MTHKKVISCVITLLDEDSKMCYSRFLKISLYFKTKIYQDLFEDSLVKAFKFIKGQPFLHMQSPGWIIKILDPHA